MSLNYSTKDIANDPSLTDENGNWIPEFQSICFATMPVGINKITKANYREFYRRYSVMNVAYGYDNYLSLEMVEKFVGLHTNASTKTISAFNKDMLAIIERRVMENTQKEIEDARIKGTNPMSKVRVELESMVCGEIVSEVVLRVYGGSSQYARVEATTNYLEGLQEFNPPISCNVYECQNKQDASGNAYVEFLFSCIDFSNPED